MERSICLEKASMIRGLFYGRPDAADVANYRRSMEQVQVPGDRLNLAFSKLGVVQQW